MAATNKRGVFSLETVLERQSDNYWSKIPEVFRYVNSIGGSSPTGTDYGYFAGGLAPSPTNSVSTVDRIDFSNETTSAPGNNLSVVRYDIGDNTFTLNYGYSQNRYLNRNKETLTAGFVLPNINLTFNKNDWSYDDNVEADNTDYEILASMNYIVSLSLRLRRSSTSDYMQVLIPFNRSFGAFGSLNFTYRNEYLKVENVVASSNYFQF